VFSDKKLVNGLQKQERAMSGYDVKLSGQAPYLPYLPHYDLHQMRLKMYWLCCALSLLITFSFNAFSVDDAQQFNKEAYLDLSKPYKQKNPQSATEKI
jgi:hypothetical protein